MKKQLTCHLSARSNEWLFRKVRAYQEDIDATLGLWEVEP